MALPDGVQHICYEHGIPSDVARHIEKIYQSPFCVSKYFEIFKGIRNPNALVISEGGSEPRHILIYVISGKEITVLNELVAIEQDYVQYFADTMFSRYPAITTVNLNYLKSRIVNFHHPWRLWKTSHDIAIPLPLTFDAYQAQLGKQTRKHLKYYRNRLQREFDDFTFHVATTHDIDPSVIDRIIEMNRSRMKNKNIQSGYNNLFETRIVEFCRHYGMISTVSAGGRIVAGTICYEVGDHTYLEAVSHDPEYNRYNPGQVCLYLTLKHTIEKGSTSFHMLWGENEYKFRLLGVKQDLYFLSIFRSYTSKISSTPKVVKHFCSYAFKQMDYLMKKYIINRCRRRR